MLSTDISVKQVILVVSTGNILPQIKVLKKTFSKNKFFLLIVKFWKNLESRFIKMTIRIRIPLKYATSSIKQESLSDYRKRSSSQEFSWLTAWLASAGLPAAAGDNQQQHQ